MSTKIIIYYNFVEFQKLYKQLDITCLLYTSTNEKIDSIQESLVKQLNEKIETIHGNIKQTMNEQYNNCLLYTSRCV